MKQLRFTRRLAGFLSLLFVAAVLAQPKDDSAEASSPYGLQRANIRGLDVAFVLPGATLAPYTKVLIEQPIDVSFHKDWNPTAPGSRRRLTTDEQLRIRSGVAKIVYDTFVTELGRGGYSVVMEPGPDVLGVRAQIINLYVTAPDVPTSGRVRTYTVSAGQMTLIAELFDSETGEVFAQVGDRRVARGTGNFTLSSSVSNSAEAQRAASSWARILRTALDNAKNIGKQ